MKVRGELLLREGRGRAWACVGVRGRAWACVGERGLGGELKSPKPKIIPDIC